MTLSLFKLFRRQCITSCAIAQKKRAFSVGKQIARHAKKRATFKNRKEVDRNKQKPHKKRFGTHAECPKHCTTTTTAEHPTESAFYLYYFSVNKKVTIIYWYYSSSSSAPEGIWKKNHLEKNVYILKSRLPLFQTKKCIPCWTSETVLLSSPRFQVVIKFQSILSRIKLSVNKRCFPLIFFFLVKPHFNQYLVLFTVKLAMQKNWWKIELFRVKDQFGKVISL